MFLYNFIYSAKFDSDKQNRRNFFSEIPNISNVNINYNINNISHFNAGPTYTKRENYPDSLGGTTNKLVKLNINSPTITEVLKNIPSRDNMKSATFKKGEVNFANLNHNYSENNIMNEMGQENSMFHSKNKSINSTSLAE